MDKRLIASAKIGATESSLILEIFFSEEAVIVLSTTSSLIGDPEFCPIAGPDNTA